MPVVPKTTVGEMIEVVRADDTPLRQTLIKDEQLVRQSAQTMQGSLNTMTVATQKSQVAAASAGQTFSVLGAQVGALGGVVGQVTSPLLSFGGALAMMGKAVFGIPGILIAVTAAVGLMVNAFIKSREKTREATAELKRFEEQARKTRDEFNKGTTSIEERVRVRGAAQRLGLAEARGPEAAAREKQRQQWEGLTRELIGAQREINRLQRAAGPELGGSKSTVVQGRIAALREEVKLLVALRLGGHKKLQDDLLRLEKDRIAKVRDEERRAADERRRLLDIQIEGSPTLRVFRRLFRVMGENLRKAQDEAVIGQLAPFLPQGLLDQLRGRGQGPIAVGVGRTTFAAGGFTDVAAARGRIGTGPRDNDQERRDTKRTRDVDSITGLLRRFLPTIGGGLQ